MEKMMMDDTLTPEERSTLLKLARETLELELRGGDSTKLNLDDFSPTLRMPGATFVTLTKGGRLRGCIGALEPYQPLVEDVREHTLAAATQDYRFPPVEPDELAEIVIEISRLTTPKPLEYSKSDDLVAKLTPGVDGVVLKDGFRKATFLPQVWNSLPRVQDFLGQLCVKMGIPSNTWKHKKLEVLVYQVEEFHE